jgi:hypothetical protein
MKPLKIFFILVSTLAMLSCTPKQKLAEAVTDDGNTVSNQNRGTGGMGTGTSADYSNGPRTDNDDRNVNNNSTDAQNTRKPASKPAPDNRHDPALKE